jgi:hypothetical protein
MTSITVPYTPPSDDDKRTLYTFAVQLRIETRGEELARTPAVDKLGYLDCSEDDWRSYCGYPVSKSVQAPSYEDLLSVWNEMKEGNPKFSANLAEAIARKKSQFTLIMSEHLNMY